VRVPVVSLDDVCHGRSPTAMKIDIEGFEMNALMGDREAVSNPSLNAIVIELPDWTLRRFGTSEEEVRRLSPGMDSFGATTIRSVESCGRRRQRGL
jgi:Methyltransferase FkbM domain